MKTLNFSRGPAILPRNGEEFEHPGFARSPFPLTSVLSLGERRNHSAPCAPTMGVGTFMVLMHARSGWWLSMNRRPDKGKKTTDGADYTDGEGLPSLSGSWPLSMRAHARWLRVNGERSEYSGFARDPFPLTSVLSLGERRNHSAPCAQTMGVGIFMVPMQPRQRSQEPGGVRRSWARTSKQQMGRSLDRSGLHSIRPYQRGMDC